LGWFL
jgi:carbohydrate ABC transporter substrate-binding protein, CUT1 family (TC 3.A.1.1.-)